MDINYKCKKQVMPNVWHHNLIIDDEKKVYKENTDVPSSPDTIIELFKDGIIFPEDGWIVDC